MTALSLEAWFRAAPGVGEQLLLGGDGFPSLAIDGPRLIFTVPTPGGERRAVADLSRLGVEDVGAQLVHAIGTVREDWACLYVEGALAATARLDGEGREWIAPPRAPRAVRFGGELGLARLYTRALAGREVLSNHRATRRDGKPAGGALWSAGPIDGSVDDAVAGTVPDASKGDAATPGTIPEDDAEPRADLSIDDGNAAVGSIRAWIPDASAVQGFDAPSAQASDAPSVRVPEAASPTSAAPPLDARVHKAGADPDDVAAPALELGPRVRRTAAPRTDDRLGFGARVKRVVAPGIVHASATPQSARKVVEPSAEPHRATVPSAGASHAVAAPAWTVRAEVSSVCAVGIDAAHTPEADVADHERHTIEGEGDRTGRVAETSLERDDVAVHGLVQPPVAPVPTIDEPAAPHVPCPVVEESQRRGVAGPAEANAPCEPATRSDPAQEIAAPSGGAPEPDMTGDVATLEGPVGPPRALAPPPALAPEPALHAPEPRPAVVHATPGNALRLDVAELAGCALVGAIAHWPVSLPGWLSLDGVTGVATGTVPARAGGSRERVVVAVANRHGARATLALDLIVAEAPPVAVDPLDAIEAAMRTAADAVPALRALVRAGREPEPNRDAAREANA